MADIIVGVDGSAHSVAALRWAHREALLRGDHLVVLFAWGFVQPGHAGDGHTFEVGYGPGQAYAALTATITEALGPEAARTVEHRLAHGVATRELLTAATSAELLVVGARGVGGVRGLLLGSVSRHLLGHAKGPLAIIASPPADPDAEHGYRRIVVGFDESPGATRALAWAAEEARRRRTPLEVVRAWHVLYPIGAPVAGYPVEHDAVEADARTGLDFALAGLDLCGLPSPVTGRLVYGAAAPAIIEAAGGADLIVLGTHGHGTVAAAVLGSVTHEIARRSRVPLVVVP